MAAIDGSKATGPDGLPGWILKRCCNMLALPVALLTRKILAEGRWPWKLHNSAPIYKRRAKNDPNNYRYRKASWDTLNTAFAHAPWDEILCGSVDDDCYNLTKFIIETAKYNIPHKQLRETKSSCPWMSDTCISAIQRTTCQPAKRVASQPLNVLTPHGWSG